MRGAMIWVADHSLCISLFGKVWMIRPCNDLTGSFTFNGNRAPWFRLRRFSSKSTASEWCLFTVPFLCFGMIRLTASSSSARP